MKYLSLLLLIACAEAPPVDPVNWRPSAPRIEVSPRLGMAWHDTLTCNVLEAPVDPDGDPIELQIRWSHDGERTDLTSTTLSADQLAPGTWTCRAWGDDGTTGGYTSTSAATVRRPGNVLILLADDMGTDQMGAYGEHPTPAHTPVLDALADQGLLFRNAYANPVCSPTRYTILYGRYSSRVGLGAIYGVAGTDKAVPTEEISIAEALDHAPEDYTSLAVGKWHLSGRYSEFGMAHPLEEGFAHHRGNPGNLNKSWLDTSGTGYRKYDRAVDGVIETSTTYATTETVDDALDLISTTPEPWLTYVAFNAPHSPYHKPPADLHTYDLTNASKVEKYQAMVEAMDTEIGRLLDEMDPDVLARTTIIFLGDNGTPGGVTTWPWFSNKAKQTVYEGGINVPMVVVSPWVVEPGREVTGLVQSPDLYATILELAAVDTNAAIPDDRALDGESFLNVLRDPTAIPPRERVYVEYYKPISGPPYDRHRRTVLDGEYKVVRINDDPDELYRLDGMLDGTDLFGDDLTPEAEAAYDRLAAELDDFQATVVNEYP